MEQNKNEKEHVEKLLEDRQRIEEKQYNAPKNQDSLVA